MWKATVAVTAVLGFAAPALAAPSDDVILRISAQGVAHSAPDHLNLTGEVSETGDTEATARAAYQGHVDRIRAAVADAGVASSSVSAADPRLNQSHPAASASSATAKPAAAFTAKGSVDIELADPTKLDMVKARLGDLLPNANPKPELTDDRKAHAAAVADAVAKARADAALYASSLGFHIVRVKSVTNDGAVDVANIVKLVQSFSNGGGGPKSIPTYASIKIEFVIAPN